MRHICHSILAIKVNTTAKILQLLLSVYA